MATPRFDRPGADEFAPFYSSYISKVPDGDLLALLREQGDTASTALAAIPEAKGGHAYAPGKWTIKEVVGHVIDAERVFSYRAMSFARQDPAALPGFDENLWIAPAKFNDRTLASLAAEVVAVRQATLALFGGFPAEAPTRRGIASNREVSVRGLGYIIHGHMTHHLAVIKERYL